jgi:hypothetical protein
LVEGGAVPERIGPALVLRVVRRERSAEDGPVVAGRASAERELRRIWRV